MEVLKPLVQEVRKAPLGTAMVLDSLAVGAASQLDNFISGGMELVASSPTFLTSVSTMVIGLVGGLTMGYRQHVLARRLEHSIINHGFVDRAFLTTTPEWCARQTARVVCEEHGVLDKYKKLCDANKSTMQLPRLPHI